MTTPTSPVSLDDVNFEIYATNGVARDMSNVHIYELGGVASGAISLNDLKTKTWTTTHVPYSANGTFSARDSTVDAILYMTCDKTCVWTYTFISGTSNRSVSRPSGSFANNISFTVFLPTSSSQSAKWNISATAGKIITSWTITLTCDNGFVTCVTTDTYLPGFGLAGAVAIGDELLVADPLTFETRWGMVSKADVTTNECVRITTASGVELKCTTEAPIADEFGKQILAPELMGHRIPVFDFGEWKIEEVVSIKNIGEQEIINISCENNFFLAGEHEGRYVLHHNLKPGP